MSDDAAFKKLIAGKSEGPWILSSAPCDASLPGLHQLDECGPLAFGWDGEEGIYVDRAEDAKIIALAGNHLGPVVAALEALFQNPHLDLGDQVYQVKEQELKGWDGPAVKQWSDAVVAARVTLDAVYKEAEG